MRLPILLLNLLLIAGAQAQTPLKNAHAHNDYHQKTPLLDALSYGFTSVEADIHLHKGELKVAHTKLENLSKSPTLEELYLLPLLAHIQKNKGVVYPNYAGHFYLMIDIKSDPDSTFTVLKALLLKYQSIISQNKADGKPVKIFISGNRPISLILSDTTRIMAIDGRPSDIGKGFTTDQMPVISENYGKFSPMNSRGKIDKQREKQFDAFIASVHKEGKRVRLWNAPDHPIMWQYLFDHGVDLINTDNLQELSTFLKSKNEK